MKKYSRFQIVSGKSVQALPEQKKCTQTSHAYDKIVSICFSYELHQISGIVEAIWLIFPFLTQVWITTQRQYIPQANIFRPVQIRFDFIQCLMIACQMEHCLQIAVVECNGRYLHARSWLVTARITSRMPCDIAKQRLASSKLFKPIG
jgi:hypothetical protein